ncbi:MULTISPECIES: hypothetical protein [unclassified Pseudomonas]|uniref:hypothetical protein n=1 Tax=unclassified Pseudomonas TaxID=196821 RepID=UPI000A0AF915|nr:MULTISPECIES: hypothetical protein [unclassified Pseudomonas]SMF37013.1 hypothetical protein SAMN02745962_03333 [Pseudomonas sp. LAIL14HWK12:I11]SMR78962.1 hypothetical protein SAMN05661028_03768 [Pseudomonas sp. LAIL14HWK12:I10]SOD04720.1 hypothetical protein SAMN05660296_03317 [Pseudomonas sp. LAIL14HWK12:I8]
MKSEASSLESPTLELEANPKFFATKDHGELVRNVRIKLGEQMTFSKDGLAPKDLFVLEGIHIFTQAVENSPSVFDESCAFNIENIGSQLMSRLGSVTELDYASREEVFAMCYRFLIELQLSVSVQLSSDLHKVLHGVRDFEWSGMAGLQLQYAEHQMLIGVVKKFIHHPGISRLRDLPETIERSEKERVALEEQISGRESRIEALNKNLQKYESAFNFVALYDGFKGLRGQKRRESLMGLCWMVVLGGVMMVPFIGKLYLAFKPVAGVQVDIYTYMSLIGLELVLLFLFRVALHGYRAVKAQLIQIDLRMALCQFIQGYVEYAAQVRKSDSQLLERFEQLIFSGIVTSEGAIPSTFDGFEQLASLISKIKDAK